MADKHCLIEYKELMKEWDWDKNKQLNLDPSNISAGSNMRAWWICQRCGYSRRSPIFKRTIEHHSCPSCSKNVVTSMNNVLVTNPEIAKRWDYSKNLVKPGNFISGSNKKVWFLCTNGHSYETSISNFVKGHQCPYCCNQRILPGFNDLATRPDLLRQWDFPKNVLKPTVVMSGTSRVKVWWVFQHGHEYKMTPANKSQGQGCPVCSKERQTSFPEQAIYFYLKKYTDALNRYLLDDKVELDVFLPEMNIGIEYDENRYHKGIEAAKKEEKKNSYCADKHVRLIRIKEVPEQKVDENDIIYYVNQGREYSFLKDVLRRLFKLINIENCDNFDIKNDEKLIYEQYLFLEKKRKNRGIP